MEAYQYAHKSSLCEIPNTLMHEGTCLSDARSCYCGRHAKRVRRSQVALFCSPGVRGTTQTHSSAHTNTHTRLTAAGTDVVILGCEHTESRLAGERVCVRVS